jgi:hypothetical protein
MGLHGLLQGALPSFTFRKNHLHLNGPKVHQASNKKREAEHSSETSVYLYQSARRHSLQDSTLHEQSVGWPVKLLLALASTVIPNFDSHRNT